MDAFVDDPFLDIIDVDSLGNAFDIHGNPIPPRTKPPQ